MTIGFFFEDLIKLNFRSYCCKLCIEFLLTM